MNGGITCYICDPDIYSCIIADNLYAGITAVVSRATITNCLICGNAADEFGGGIQLADSDAVVTNCTIAVNSAGEGGGGIVCGMYSSPTVANCIVWGNIPSEIVVELGSPLVSYSDVGGGWPGQGNLDADPLFVGPGGDLDGLPRFIDAPHVPDTGNGTPPIVDMGAHEFQADCPGDLNGDRVVNQADLGILLAAWESTVEGDLNCDGVADQPDLGILLANWGNVCP